MKMIIDVGEGRFCIDCKYLLKGSRKKDHCEFFSIHLEQGEHPEKICGTNWHAMKCPACLTACQQYREAHGTQGEEMSETKIRLAHETDVWRDKMKHCKHSHAFAYKTPNRFCWRVPKESNIPICTPDKQNKCKYYEGGKK